MTRRFALVALLAASLVGVAIAPAGAAGGGGGKDAVVTTMTFVDPAAGILQTNVGELRAKFIATPAATPGRFDLAATFRPRGLVHTLSVPFGGFFSGTVHNDARVSVEELGPGATAILTATGMRAGHGADARPLTLSCVVTVDSSGRVSVLALSLLI